MTPSSAVHSTSHYQRLSTKLQKSQRDFEATELSAVAILAADPHNRSPEAQHQETGGRAARRKASIGFPSADGVSEHCCPAKLAVDLITVFESAS
jgi:hypothetical protein